MRAYTISIHLIYFIISFCTINQVYSQDKPPTETGIGVGSKLNRPSDFVLVPRPTIKSEKPSQSIINSKRFIFAPERLHQRETNEQIQKALKKLGFYTGAIDGAVGPLTKKSISLFQSTIGKNPTGTLETNELVELMEIYVNSIQQDIFKGIVPAAYINGDVRASRIFAGPSDYPPSDFAAYGIIAFKSGASPYDRERYMMICEAFIKSILPFRKLEAPKNQQMVTVWPIADSEMAAALETNTEMNVCDSAVDGYGLVSARRAINQAKAAGVPFEGIGPYLLAWSPSKTKGETDAVVLVADLTSVKDYDQAVTVMFSWTEDIERDPNIWLRGWSIESLRLKMQKWFDSQGTRILAIVQPS